MRVIAVVVLAAASLALAAHADPVGGVYVHSDGLAKQADAIDAAVQGATTLKPYDDQLVNLTAFAAKEDLAVATLMVARRDQDVQAILGQPADGPRHRDERVAILLTKACQRITLAASPGLAVKPPALPCTAHGDPTRVNTAWFVWARDQATTGRLLRVIQDQAQAAAAVKDSLVRFARLYPTLTTPKDCEAAQAMAKAPPAAANAAADLKDLVENQCFRLSRDNAQLKSSGWPPQDATIGGQVMAAAAADQTAEAASAAAALKPLQTKLDALQAAAKKNTDLSALTKIETDLQQALSALDPAEKLVGLNHVQAELDQVEAVLACGSPCSTPPTGSVGVKADAVVGLLNALAQNEDVAAGRGAINHWIDAAQAIVGSYKADAQSQTATAAAMAAITLQTQLLAVGEIGLLSQSVLLSQAWRPTLDSDDEAPAMAGCDGKTAFYCALSAYVDSWNVGRAPAEVLKYRQVQVYRAFLVQRQRQAAQAQRNVLLAATATLKAYGDGGVQPQAVAQFLGAFGIIAIAAK